MVNAVLVKDSFLEKTTTDWSAGSLDEVFSLSDLMSIGLCWLQDCLRFSSASKIDDLYLAFECYGYKSILVPCGEISENVFLLCF